MTVPRHRENPLIIKCSMLCAGISQNTKHHHLTLYKGQVWEEKSYLELCNHNALNIVYHMWSTNFQNFLQFPQNFPIEQNGELSVPPVPSELGFNRDYTQIPWDSEILQSFAKLTNITSMTFQYYDSYEDSLEGVTYQIIVSCGMCFYRGVKTAKLVLQSQTDVFFQSPLKYPRCIIKH